MKFNVVNFTGKKCEKKSPSLSFAKGKGSPAGKKCEKKIGYCPSASSGTKEEIGYALLKPGYWNADENYGY